VPEVRVIGPDGKQLGIMKTSEALELAYSQNLDLVEVAPHERPPVVKIMDYGKFKYEMKKREKASKKTSKAGEVKEIGMRPHIDDHDLQIKMRKMREFLEAGMKVRIKVMFRGREVVHKDHGEKLLKRIIDELSDIATVDVPIQFEGRIMSVLLRSTVKRK